MGRVYDDISEEQALWIGEQSMFFVATAAPDAHVNVSPRGLDTFRVLGPRRVAWLDLTGSGVETISHLRADGRITLMFCAFEGLPKILRLYGLGEVREPGDAGYDGLRTRFPNLPGERAIIDVSVGRIADSCGFGVPRMDLIGPRDKLLVSAERKGPEKMDEYRKLKNSRSIDGLPGLDPARSGR
ncbi:MAG: pyridoxamine 5'-phosphate oxidase family protein [Rubrobacteraceae bacterium]|nr:pyridoxamine 5'-phosphate oxidase family protein [Rubrobacteraceae bacterium]